MNAVAAVAGRGWNAWCRFWFESERPLNLSWFRRGLGTLLLIFYCIRSIDLGLFFSERGWLPLMLVRELYPPGLRWSLLHLSPSDAWLWALNAVFIASLLFLAFEKWPRVAAACAFALHLSFLNRNPGIAYGADLIATFFLFFLIFCPSGEARPGAAERMLASMAYRLLQAQVCIIYFFSGIDKLTGDQWRKGEALWYVLTNDQISRWDFSWLSGAPSAVALLCYATVLWEIYFPLAVWIRPLRPWVLWGGVAMHLGIALTMTIPFFSALMVLSYVLFVDPPALRQGVDRVCGFFRTRGKV